MAARLSVNVNKVATLRNSRGGAVPSVIGAVETCVAAGAPGITVHPRADERHIQRADVTEISAWLRAHAPGIEFNIEGDPRPDLIELVHAVRPDQCTLVPVTPGEITSHAGWSPDLSPEVLRPVVQRMRDAGIRVSVFVDPEEAAVRWAAATGANRVELYTEPYARAFARGAAEGHASYATYRRVAETAHALGLGVNAGHDLDLDNLTLFHALPHLDEVSIGHALIARALWVGLEQTVVDYLRALQL